ncbi:MAG: VWA domain-containing protein [Acidobacteria bacterium]|uniref:VWA domain-containing protein n=1 Tax=Candidatus Polarisedimenticola svalbardensis TaxID=2886004 RepID=A0A8J7CEU7_9BACT|nr:VWA domain-containing protein [Candidatus Polarisedimenticola svalbardensis]
MIRVFLIIALLLAPAAAAQEDLSLADDVEVTRVVVDIRAVDPKGVPIGGLIPEDFVVRVEGDPVPVSSLDWVSGSVARLSPEEVAALPDDHPLRSGAGAGRLIVIFFQRSLVPTRIAGTMRMLQETREFVGRLQDNDYVATVFFQSHLELVQDFTNDKQKILAILDDQIVPYRTQPPAEPGPYPSLAAFFDVQAGLDAATPEHGLRVTAEALKEIPGSKSMLFVGWGVGIMVGGVVKMRPEYEPARQALAEARVSVFSLDVTRADYHSLEGPLIRMALDTGGFYVRTYDNANVAMGAVEKAIAGHYVLAFEKPQLPEGRHRMRIRLKNHKGVVYHREYYND